MNLKPIVPDEGDLFPIDDFLNMCRVHALVDYDGSGYLATETETSDISIIPSEVLDLRSQAEPFFVRDEVQFTHILWMNR